ncbi:MAG: hypothetical protein IGS50_19300 [Synechococcales cyanobacterium C42_A2020_086]|jgi:hypothetical protein|nr:hypothetical protein [Synechococcales cyanobacterium C42_A2020_086]
MGSVNWGKYGVVIGAVLASAGCSTSRAPVPLRTIQIQQAWQLQSGDSVGEYRIAAGLGDVSLELNGGTVYAPFSGQVQPTDHQCVLFSSPEVPAYLFRLCGLKQPRLGEVRQGDAIGAGAYLHFATLRRQPEGTWTFVEPSRSILERLLQPP